MGWVARMLGAGAVVLGLACGSGSGGGNNSPDQPTTGTATFSGAATGTLSVAVLAGYESPQTAVDLAIDSAAGSYPSLTFNVQLPGTSLQAGTFTSSNVTEAITLYLSTGEAGPSWEQVFALQPPSNTGTFSLTLTSAGPSSSGGTVTSWVSPHGTLTATLQPLLMSSGAVNVSVTF